ncbi:unnamed protein product, partial [Meganyctiphanes norvegica]
MKLILVIVFAAIALFTVDAQSHFGDEPDVAQQQPEKGSLWSYLEARSLWNESGLRGSKCRAHISCIVLGGSCVTNPKKCSGRLVPGGCRGDTCQCCVPEPVNQCVVNDSDNSELYYKVNSAETSVIDKINEGNVNVTRALDKKVDNLEEHLHSIEDQLDYIIEHLR